MKKRGELGSTFLVLVSVAVWNITTWFARCDFRQKGAQDEKHRSISNIFSSVKCNFLISKWLWANCFNFTKIRLSKAGNHSIAWLGSTPAEEANI